MYTLCTGSYSNPLDRQLQERVNITSFKRPILMNRRNEMGGVSLESARYMRCPPGMEVSPAQRHPASQQGGRGWSITRMEEPGGRWRLRFSTTLLNSYKEIWFQSICELWIGGETHNTMYQFSAELKREKIALHESESFYFVIVLFQSAVDWQTYPMYQFSAELRGTRWTKCKWKFYHTHWFFCWPLWRISVLDLEDESTRMMIQ